MTTTPDYAGLIDRLEARAQNMNGAMKAQGLYLRLGDYADEDAILDREVAAALRSQQERIDALEKERDEADGTLKYCERKWCEERGTMIDKIQYERARADAAETRVKELETALADAQVSLDPNRETGWWVAYGYLLDPARAYRDKGDGEAKGYCTDCENETTIHDGRCGCGSGRVIPGGRRPLPERKTP